MTNNEIFKQLLEELVRSTVEHATTKTAILRLEVLKGSLEHIEKQDLLEIIDLVKEGIK